MSDMGLPVLLAILVWWASTGVILYLDGLGRSSFRWSMVGATALSLLAIVALHLTSGWNTPAGAYIAFMCALTVWGWNEMAFLMGFLSGSRRTPCPPDATGFKRFRYASETVMDHELGIVASGVVIAVATWGAPNQFGLYAFAILWIMRLSTKLNIFLGAPNIPDEFLPQHLRYLASYFRRRPMNGLFPFSITGATLLTGFLMLLSFDAQATPFERTGYVLLTTLMALAVLEHWLLYVPLNATRIWAWGLKSHERTAKVNLVATPTVLQDNERAPNALSMSTWSVDLSGPCDPRALSSVLDAVIFGTFGHVERLHGAARTGDGWLRFTVTDGCASVDKVAQLDTRHARVTATGRAFDGEKLSAAFAACAG